MTGEILFHGDSHEIDWIFDGTQRAILVVLFWKVLSRQAQRHRRYFAAQDRLYSATRQNRYTPQFAPCVSFLQTIPRPSLTRFQIGCIRVKSGHFESVSMPRSVAIVNKIKLFSSVH